MPNLEVELTRTLSKMRRLFAKAKAIAEPILQRWEAEARAKESSLRAPKPT